MRRSLVQTALLAAPLSAAAQAGAPGPQNKSQPALGNTQTFSDPANKNQEGSAVRNLTIIGDRATQTQQHAMSFYNNASSVFIDNVTVSYMRGHAFGTGFPTQSGPGVDANLIESRLLNAAFDHDGDGNGTNPTAPALDIGSSSAINTHSVEGSNNLDLTNLAITSPFGPGIAIHASNTGSKAGPRQIRLTNVHVEGTNLSLLSPSLATPPDLLLLDASGLGTQSINDISCRNLQLVNPVMGAAALHIANVVPPTTVNNIDCEGSIVSEPSALLGGTAIADYGRGAVVEGCQQCKITMAANSAQDYQLVAGIFTPGAPPSCTGPGSQPALTAPGLIYDGAGAESNLTTCVDPLSLNLLAFPNRQLLANGNLANTTPPNPIQQITSSVSGSGTSLTFTVSASGVPPVISISVAVPLWTIIHSGNPGTTLMDTLDNATGIIAAINISGGSYFTAAVGQIYRLRYCNQTSVVGTLAAGVGVNGPPFTIPAGSCTSFLLELTGPANMPPTGVTITAG